ncbi:protein O-mannosyl-transferase TMTC1-like [Anopheles cruzii]|uniref:protein O-mannosyl-transferase TMTC1-like n=1 Tax=Anopheles cruzii TaxID=68878 RepID=UPI0022EC6E8F|nr:protein O-mannosyl-transferase TMTC1-like [Anopheles cruzii]
MTRRVTIVYSQSVGRGRPGGSRWEPGPGARSIDGHLHPPTAVGSLCLSCMATSSSAATVRLSSSSATSTSSASSSSSSSSSSSVAFHASSQSFPCQRCCSISSILKSPSPSSSLSASENAAQIEDALNNNHHQQQNNHQHYRQQQHHHHHHHHWCAECASGPTKRSPTKEVAVTTTTATTTATKDIERGDRAGGVGGGSGQQSWAMYPVVGLIAALCYLNGIHGDFVHDDVPAITLNKDVLGLSPVAQVFRNDFWGTPMADLGSHKSYRPLTTLTFRLNYLTFGLRSIWFHATNVALHAAATVLFTRVCLTIAGLRRNFAILAGILFAVHPIHTEAVTGIVGRADVLACIFFLISLLVYHGRCHEPDMNSLWLSIVLGGLSMLAKETGITVFVLNVAYDAYRNWPALKRTVRDMRWSEETHQFGRRVSRVLLSMGVLLAVRLALLQGSLPRFSQQDNPTAFHPNLYVRLLTFCYLAAFNWWLLLCPSTLSHDWQMGSIPLVTTLSDPRNLLTFIAFGAALLFTYRGLTDGEHQRHVPLVLGLLLLVLPFLPATNLVVTVGFVVAERVLYIPSMGCLILVVYGAQRLWERFRVARKPILFLGAILLTAGCLKTIARNRDWSSREALLRSGLQTLPHNAKMHYNFGNFLRDSSKPEPAIAHYREALRLWPSYASAHNNLGTLMPRFETAEYHFREAIKYSSEHINAHYNLGQLYRKSNRTGDAIRMLERCIQLEPLFTGAYLELVKLYGGPRAGQLLRRIVRLAPYNADLRRQYGDWLLEQGMLLEAIKQYQEGIKIMETHQLSVIGACRCLRRMGQQARLHQMVLRWQFIVRLSNGGIPIQNDIYLRDWSIKHELRNRAMIYDSGPPTPPPPTASAVNGIATPSGTTAHEAAGQTGGDSGAPCPGTTVSDDPTGRSGTGSSIKDCATHRPGTRSTPAESAEISIRILRTPHCCNRSEHLPSSLKGCKLAAPPAHGTPDPAPSATGPSAKSGAKTKKWSKVRHKPKRHPASGGGLVDPNGALAPLLVSNLLDKL